MSDESCEERSNHDDSRRKKHRTVSPHVDGDNRSNDGFFTNVKGSAAVKRAREGYEERRRKMAQLRRPRTDEEEKDGSGDRTENVEVEDLLPPSYRLFTSTPHTDRARLRFRAKRQDDGEEVYVLPTITNRGLVKELLCEFEENGGKEEGMYVHGLRGIGKSHSLLYLVHQLRAQPDKYRVTYVHDCSLWVSEGDDAWSYILDELLFTFALDKFPPDSEVHECCAKMLSAVREDYKKIQTRFYALVHALIAWVRSEKLIWVAVFGQVNALGNVSKAGRRLPATCAWAETAAHDTISGTFVTVVSASDSNEEKNQIYRYLHQVPVAIDLARFTNEETMSLVKERFPGKMSLNDMEDDIEYLYDRTSNMPWNVVSVLRAPSDNLREMVDIWEHGPGRVGGYTKEVLTAHEEYRRYLKREVTTNHDETTPLQQLEFYIGCAMLHAPVRIGNHPIPWEQLAKMQLRRGLKPDGIMNEKWLDRRYMYIGKEDSNREDRTMTDHQFCYFCDPVAKSAIVQALEDTVSVLDTVAQCFLSWPTSLY